MSTFRQSLPRQIGAIALFAAACVLPALAQEPGGTVVVSPAAARLLARASFTEPLELELHLRPEATAESLGEAASATFTLDREGQVALTLNDRAVTARDFEAYTAVAKQRLADLAAVRERNEEARQAAAVRQAELDGRVVAAAGRVLQVRVTRGEAERGIRLLGDELAFVDVVKPVFNAMTNATTTNNQGALEATRVIPFAHGYGLQGSGVGVWLEEGGSPNMSNPAVNSANLRYLTGDPVDVEHATLTTVTLQKTAPKAVVYYGNQPAGCHLLASIVKQTSPPIYLGSHSWNWGDTTTDDYGTCAAEWDDFVYNNRLPMFVPSGGNDEGQFTTTPGKAFNVVAVGGSDTDESTIPAFSGWRNPETGAIKPDVVAPGTCIAIMPGYDCVSGVSIATPIAAGFAADMIGGSAFFRNQPQAVKAYMVAGATTDIIPGGIAMDGPGQIDFLSTWFYRWGKWWNGGNSAFFDANKEITEVRNLTANHRYRIAISWLTTGSYVYLTKRPSMEMSLTVTGGGKSFESSYPHSTSQWVDFVAPASGNYTIKIKRTFNAAVSDVALALTVGEVL